MAHPLIIDAIRTPMGRGKPGGALSHVHPVDLLAGLLRQLITRNDVDPGTVDDVIVGCVSQVGEQAGSPGRMAWLSAGFPEHVPATTVDRRCGSSQQAVHFAAQGIAAGAYDLAVAAGVESMSRVPMFSARIGRQPYGDQLLARYPGGLIPQGISAERIAARWKISRDQLDEFSAESHRRAAASWADGAFTGEVMPVGSLCMDETIRAATTTQGLSQLKPSFYDAAMQERFPEIEWSITAGNSSQLADGAAAVLLASEATAARLNLTPRARFVAFDVIGDDPIMMLTAPIASTRRVLAKSGMSIAAMDHVEVNEAFACVPLAWNREFGLDPRRLNPRGGAIALGHPLGASGARLLTTMLHSMAGGKARYGLQTMCEAGGLANSTIIERL